MAPEQLDLQNRAQKHPLHTRCAQIVEGKQGKFFSIPDALNSLSEEFIVSGTAPSFAKEWTWYKDVEESNVEKNARLVEAYFNNVLNFVDRRGVSPGHSQELGKQIENIASNVWNQVCRIENGESDLWSEIFQSLAKLSLLIDTEAPETARSIDEAVKWIKGGLQEEQLTYFPSWWGRGQLHVCVCRGKFSS